MKGMVPLTLLPYFFIVLRAKHLNCGQTTRQTNTLQKTTAQTINKTHEK